MAAWYSSMLAMRPNGISDERRSTNVVQLRRVNAAGRKSH